MSRIRETLIDIAGLRAIKFGAVPGFREDSYYQMLTMRWRYFVALVFSTYFFINVLFALLYLAQPGSVKNARDGSFADHFFFSVETLATVGYGVRSPATFYAHIIATTEIFLGMFLTASITALAFARFATPRANLIFSDVATIAPHESGYMAMTVRVANRRHRLMADMSARVAIWRATGGGDTPRSRGLEDLKLLRPSTPVLGLFWPLVHIIDADSPLAGGVGPDAVWSMDLLMIVSVSGTDEALSATVGARKTYLAKDFRWGNFVPVIAETPDGTPRIDLTRLSDLRDAV